MSLIEVANKRVEHVVRLDVTGAPDMPGPSYSKHGHPIIPDLILVRLPDDHLGAGVTVQGVIRKKNGERGVQRDSAWIRSAAALPEWLADLIRTEVPEAFGGVL